MLITSGPYSIKERYNVRYTTWGGNIDFCVREMASTEIPDSLRLQVDGELLHR